MYDIDVHIILFHEPAWKVRRCLDSLSRQPVNLHFVKGVREKPPEIGRRKGFSMGSAMYQSLVDPDDVVKPGAFGRLLEHKGADLIYGKEEAIMADGRVVGASKGIHHAYLLKRDSFSLEEKVPRCIDTYRAAKARGLDIQFVDEVLYEWHERGYTWI